MRNHLVISKISAMHFFRLTYRSIMLLLALIIYIFSFASSRINIAELPTWVLTVIWCVFVFEMISRFFPSSFEGKGCEKQFAKNYIPTGKPYTKTAYVEKQNKAAFIVFLFWILLNGTFGVLYLFHIFTKEVMLLIALTYSVCDMICILFFCPFHTLIMKNKCCGTCRIYNWDYAMIFTPFLFIPSFFTWSLLGIALILMIKWEILIHLHPERFYEMTNASLSCRNCEEKLCHHKKSLQHFLSTQKENYSSILDDHLKNIIEHKNS